MAKKQDGKLLTEAENELMNILWRIQEGTVAEVIEQLPAGRDLAYTSVSTILRILEQKKVLKARKEGRGHVYVPVLSKVDYEARTVRHMVEKVFESPLALAKQLIETGDLSRKDIEELKKLLERAGK
jgi:predicted transcriptional regulator